MTAKLPPNKCAYCGTQFDNAKRVFCNSSCRNRKYRNVPLEKAFRHEPVMKEMPVREWRTIDLYPNYEISNDGRVRRSVGGSNKRAGDPIRCKFDRRGYPSQTLTDKNGKASRIRSHRLVAFAFLPAPLPHQTWVLHWDDDKLNPRVDNLRWGDAQDNADDRERLGSVPKGENHYLRKRVA